MIRRSTAIATAAILLSVVLHVLGLGLTSRGPLDPPVKIETKDEVAIGTAFEDVASPLSDPVPTEPAPVPDPPVTTPPEPDLADTPTSEALVASDDPQQVFAPDTGSAKATEPEPTAPAPPDTARTPQPQPVAPVRAEPEATPPVTPDADATPPKGQPTPAPQPERSETIAALPSPAVPAPPIAPTPGPSPTVTAPLDSEPVPPDATETTTNPEKDMDDDTGSETAVVASIRPPRRAQPPQSDPSGRPDGSEEFSELLFPPLMESPLAAYQSGQSDPFAGQTGGDQAGELSFLGSGGPGNSDITNYAGRVLVHLNRATAIRVPGRGAARVIFVINADGSLARVDIIESTGSREIEEAAKAHVRRAAPFPRPPGGNSRKLAFVYRNN